MHTACDHLQKEGVFICFLFDKENEKKRQKQRNEKKGKEKELNGINPEQLQKCIETVLFDKLYTRGAPMTDRWFSVKEIRKNQEKFEKIGKKITKSY